MRLTRRVAVLAVASLTALVACAPGADSGSDDENVTLSVWGWGPEANYDKMFAEYTKDNPGVKVDARSFTTATEYDTILSTGLAGKDGPDVAWLRAGAPLQPLVAAGRLVPLDNSSVPGLADFNAGVLQGAKGDTDGKVYGVPFAIQTLHVIYNKKIFADNGIAPPKTWEDMIAAAQKLQAAKIVPFAVGGKDDWTLPIITSIFGTSRWGGDAFLDEVKAGKKTFADPNFVAGVDLVNQLKPYFPKDVAGVSYTDAQTLFSAGKAAMFPGGIWEVNFFRTNAPGLDLGTFSAPPPPGSVAGKALLPGFMDGSYGVSANSKHREEALKLLSWLASKKYGQLYTDTVVQFSAVPGVEPKDPILREVAGTYTSNGARYFMNEFAYGNPSSQTVFSAALQEMLLGRITAAQAAAKLDASVATWLKPR
ncbi:ABC transporter substrate-binding protein [Phytohabitans aurantiacus]|jgi:raffinose/stachyose/melibiose transport system substrate-binding protein|uniref:Sugar ABC transporter substrate-binding protein n=1 Tax=Phytohabitans aurantiacus TaxID=3016789 RepID=A0ABQ5QPR3_9ACTN|nr:extracellular solute-binding protein [Phytohabitans aurantiacus]GLH96423.1 sugar ABC transporter substrate-binding protein [Phytohabitans aurantiacus]